MTTSSELRVASLKHHYGLTRPVSYGAPKGAKCLPIDDCRTGDKCPRIHYEQIKANSVTKVIAIRQCTNVVKKEPDTLAMLVGHINSDPLFLQEGGGGGRAVDPEPRRHTKQYSTPS